MNQKSRFAFIHMQPFWPNVYKCKPGFFCITRQHYSSMNAKKKNCDIFDGKMMCMHHTSSHPQYCNQMILPTSIWPQVEKKDLCNKRSYLFYITFPTHTNYLGMKMKVVHSNFITSKMVWVFIWCVTHNACLIKHLLCGFQNFVAYIKPQNWCSGLECWIRICRFVVMQHWQHICTYITCIDQQ